MFSPHIPLAERLRPSSIDEYLGQDHLLGKNGVLRRSIEAGHIPSMILWGPPGSGKTTLAFIISRTLNRPFYTLSAVHSGVKEVREIIEKSHKQENIILFIDEIHRFNKAQQDSLLSAVESGRITLIGATTENPSFEVISPLLSRCQVFVLNPLSIENLEILIHRAINELEQQTGKKIEITEKEALFRISGGDARKLLNALELAVNLNSDRDQEVIRIDNQRVLDAIQQQLALYDKSGEMHYDIISAFIKSVRGSDPNAAVYWLARMIEGGEDPLFIARRMIILASEDIGNANPNALLLANACFDAVHKIGYPEARIVLAQTAIYLAASPKSNSAYKAIEMALELVRQTGDLPVPLHLRNAPTRLMKDLGYGENYLYAHDFPGNFVTQEFFPEKLKGTTIYTPGKNQREDEIRKWLLQIWKDKYNYQK